MKVTILTDSETRSCVSMDKETIAAVAGGFSRMANGEATIPPILRIDVPDNNGEVAQDWHR